MNRDDRSSFWAASLELALLAAWAAWVGRDLLDFNPLIWPSGNEFGTQVISLHFWTDFTKCGLCALWNGWVNGGWPALADPFGTALHPAAAAATLLWGVVNGAKVVVIFSMWVAGLAQWWIAHSLGVGRIPRLWSSAIAVSAGHVVGRMQLGAFGLGLSIAMGSLVLAGILAVGLSARRNATLLLALSGAATVVSSHGYVQASLLLWAAPAFLLPQSLKRAWKEYVLALGLAALVASIFLVPWLHYWPQAAKYLDPTFEAAQPFKYTFSNLVINVWSFYLSTSLDKWAYPYLYNLFIGWIPVGLAALALPLAEAKDRRSITFLLLGALTMFWFASAAPMHAISRFLPGIAALRHTPIFASLAVPAILGCSGYGLHRVMQALLIRAHQSGLPARVSWVRWLVLSIISVPLAISLKQVSDFAVYPLATVDRTVGHQLLSQLHAGDQWVAFPYGEHLWVEMGVDLGMKATGVATPWWWDQRPSPDPYLEITRSPTRFSGFQEGDIRGIPIYVHPDNEYAAVVSQEGVTSCKTSGQGGHIDAICDVQNPGVLVVRENSWSGWSATVDGHPLALIESRWLSANALPGSHMYRFRYLPWDAGVGALLSLSGMLAVTFLFLKERRTSRATPNIGA